MWPASGKLFTAFRREHENSVSTPSQYGDEADSAMKCGT
jgi:hypothetical protein